MIGMSDKLGRQFPPLTFPMSLSPSSTHSSPLRSSRRRRRVPLGEALCGYHAPSSGWRGLRTGQDRDTGSGMRDETLRHRDRGEGFKHSVKTGLKMYFR